MVWEFGRLSLMRLMAVEGRHLAAVCDPMFRCPDIRRVSIRCSNEESWGAKAKGG